MTCDIVSIVVDESLLVRSKESKVDRDRVITDLLKNNVFSINEISPPYILYIQIVNSQLIISIDGEKKSVKCSLISLRRVIKDYYIMCESYLDVINRADPRKIESIDMGRRGIHNEGAEELIQLFAQQDVTMDFNTARKMFSLIYFMYS